jgi:hypothetical protein
LDSKPRPASVGAGDVHAALAKSEKNVMMLDTGCLMIRAMNLWERLSAAIIEAGRPLPHENSSTIIQQLSFAVGSS